MGYRGVTWASSIAFAWFNLQQIGACGSSPYQSLLYWIRYCARCSTVAQTMILLGQSEKMTMM